MKEVQTKFNEFNPTEPNNFKIEQIKREDKPRKTYPQNWVAYNQAQTNEKLLFMQLLRDLTELVAETEKPKQKGRPFLDKAEMLFCMSLMIYGSKSSRISVSEFKIAKKLGFINHVPNFNTVLKYFDKPNIECTLKDFITLTAIPLKQFDDGVITIDASGFSTTMFERWVDYKWGKGKKCKQRVWRKASVVSGVKTNVITAVEITDGHKHDTLMFKDLVERTAQKLRNIKEVSADMAYSSRSILDKCHELGIIPYIPFKKNVTGKSRGSYTWMKMFKYFTNNREEFNRHYHLRSNAESVFSMQKRKFSHRLRTKKVQAQNNEILTMCLCHNICCIIKAVYEFSNVKTDFIRYAESILHNKSTI